jgi:phenylacetate-CoA ligase
MTLPSPRRSAGPGSLGPRAAPAEALRLSVMSQLENAYRRSPIAIQHAMATAFGLKERALRHRGRFREYVDQLERDQWQTPEYLAQMQAARLRAMVAFCVEQVPHYTSLFEELGLTAADIGGPADLKLLPILDKEVVRADPEAFRPLNLRERIVSQTTGGTTGTPLRYWVTASAVQYNYAAYEARFRHWAGVALGDRMASINGRKIVPIEQTKPPFWRHNLAFNQLYLSAYHLTEENLPRYVDQLEKYRPNVIVGYASSVHLIADFINRNGLEGRVRPTAVLVSSETLFPWMRADIERAFSCKVHDGYGLGELAAFITECASGGYHISPEYGVVEAVEIDGEKRLIATGLFNRAMPLLRYDTGDVVELADPSKRCPCGRDLPLVDKLLGRADDHVVTPEGRSVGPAPLSLAFQSVAGISEAQIRQDDPSAVTVSLVVLPDFGAADQELLDQELRERLGPNLAIDYEQVESIPRTTWGKRRLVDSRVGRRERTEG